MIVIVVVVKISDGGDGGNRDEDIVNGGNYCG